MKIPAFIPNWITGPLGFMWEYRRTFLAGALVVFIAWLWISKDVLKKDLATSEKNLETQIKQNKQIAEAAASFEAAHNRGQAVIARLNAENEARRRKAAITERTIRNVPKDQDGGVAPVLSDSLERMRIVWDEN